MYDNYFDSAYASVQNESERYELERNEREYDEQDEIQEDTTSMEEKLVTLDNLNK